MVTNAAIFVAIVVASFFGALVAAIYAARPFVHHVHEGFRKLDCEAPPQGLLEFKLTTTSETLVDLFSNEGTTPSSHRFVV